VNKDSDAKTRSELLTGGECKETHAIICPLSQEGERDGGEQSYVYRIGHWELRGGGGREKKTLP